MFGNHYSQKLSAYCLGELASEESRRVAEHLLHCRQCRKEWEEIKFGAQLAGRLSNEVVQANPAAPESLWREIEKELDRPPRKLSFELASIKFTPGRVAAGAILALVIGVLILRLYPRGPGPALPDLPNLPAWDVALLEGEARIGGRRVNKTDRLAQGEWLVTGDAARAQISVGMIGEVKVAPNSRVRLVQAGEEKNQLSLAQGKLEAFIWAPPGQFFVETPSAVAIDLGCAYTLEVKENGDGLLHVTLGWVAFEYRGRESFVPAEAICLTRLGAGPGTPYFADAPAELQSALARFDFANSDAAARLAAIEAVIAQSRKRDALTLWHLLSRTNESERGIVYDRLAELIPPPPRVTREGLLRGDRAQREMLDLWWDKLGLGSASWWRIWKGPLPSPAKELPTNK